MPPSRMPDDSLVALFVRPLNRVGIPYLVTGGVARGGAHRPRPLQHHPRGHGVARRLLEYFRDGASDRHLSDIAAMVRISENLIDRDTLDSLVRQRGLEGEWVRAVRHDLP